MAHRHIHYESAFEDYLRVLQIPYVPVDEARRSLFAGEKIKSFDFLVYPGSERHWLVDVKGRHFPYMNEKGTKRYWENWVTQADLTSLAEWQNVFGEAFEARFVFAYLLDGPPDRWPVAKPHRFQGDEYAFMTVTLLDYREACKPRSTSWETVSIDTERFREIIRPVEACGVQA